MRPNDPLKSIDTVTSIKDNRHKAIENNVVVQRFILPKGFQANILRLVYHTGNSRENKVNNSFFYSNREITFVFIGKLRI